MEWHRRGLTEDVGVPTGISSFKVAFYSRAKPNLRLLSPAITNCLEGLCSMKCWKENIANSTDCSMAWRSKVECLLSNDQEQWSRCRQTSLLINTIQFIYMSQGLSSFYQLHVSLVSSLHNMKHCVLFVANSGVLLNCHVPFLCTYIHTPQIISSWVIHTC